MAPRPPRLSLGWLLLGLLAASCASASADPPPSRPAPGASRSATSPTGAPRVRYALAAHPERASIRFRSSRVLELGGEAGAQHTAGGWLSNFGPNRALDGTDVAISVRSRARLGFSGPAERVAVRLRSFRPGTLRVYVDGEELPSAPLEAGAFVVIERAVALGAGEHELLLRFDRGMAIEGLARAYLAVDWVRLGPDEAGDERPVAAEVDGVATWSIPQDWTVAHPFEVPSGARLRGVVQGRLALHATTDAGAAVPLGVVGGSDATRLDVDLSPWAGRVIQLDLRAVEGPATVYAPAVVTLDRGAPTAVRRPRHVLLYLIDTLRADRLEAYAPDTRVRAPGLSRFARGAAVFTDARAQESWTKPSVATLLSSLMPWEHTAVRDGSRVPASVPLLPEMLEERGFTTAGFVANGYVSGRFGFERGWSTFRNYIREGRSTRGEHLASDTLAWLDERGDDERLFLYVHAIDPHVPYRPPASFVSMYDPEPYRGPVDFSSDATLLERIKTGGLRLNARDRQHLEALYDGEVSYQDAQLAAILDGLERRGLHDDTLVIITADHGEELFDHGSVGHGHSLHEELVHVPLLVRVPGLPPRRVEGSSGLVDVVPTVLEALGEPVPAGLSGRSLLPQLRGDGELAPLTSVAGFMDDRRSLTVGRFKLIARSRRRFELFDLVADPREQRDLSAERPMTLAYLRGLLGLELGASPGRATPEASPRHRASEATIDAELEAQLRALGYVGTSRRR